MHVVLSRVRSALDEASGCQHDAGAPRQTLVVGDAVGPDGHPVDQDVGHADRCVRRQALAVGGEVADAAQWSRSHRLRIEDAEVGGLADGDRAPVGQPVDPRRLTGQLVDGPFDAA